MMLSTHRTTQLCLVFLGTFVGVRIFLWRNEDIKLFRGRVPSAVTIRSKELPYGDQDNVQRGKTCLYRSHAWLMPFENPWNCQECFSSGKCTALTRRDRCRPFHRKDPDTPSRLSSSHSPLTRQKSHTVVLQRHRGHNQEFIQQEIPTCSATLSLPCFNLTRCSRYGAIKVFPHGASVGARLEKAVRQTPHLIHKVDRAEDACLLVVDKDSYRHPTQLENSKDWNHGQNHYIFQSSEVFDEQFHPGMAATSDWAMDDAYNIDGYHTPLTPMSASVRPHKYKKLEINRKRRFLLTIKASIHRWDRRSLQHQWIAAEYWHQAPDIHVDTPCLSHENHDTEKESGEYDEILLNSTFWFFAGGQGVNSHSFSEVLQGGAIPVVTSDFLPPFDPDIDWSGCIVRASEARVVDIPSIVQSIPKEEVQIRQRNCANLFEQVFGEQPNSDQLFSLAMQVWAIRIRNALRVRDEMDDLTFESNPEFASGMFDR